MSSNTLLLKVKEVAVAGIKMPKDDMTLGESSVKVIVSGSVEASLELEANCLLKLLVASAVGAPKAD